MQRRDGRGWATREYILYCRVKLQKILLRTELKASPRCNLCTRLPALHADWRAFDRVKDPPVG